MYDQNMQPASVGSVVRSTVATCQTNYIALGVILLIINIPINLIVELIPFDWGKGYAGVKDYYRAQQFLNFWIGTLAELCVVHIAVAAHRGERISFKESFVRAGGNYRSALWANFLFGLGVGIGTILLIVPGIALAVYYMFYLQQMAVRGSSGMDSLHYSHRFIKARWWLFFGKTSAILGIYVLTLAIILVFTAFLPEVYLVNVFSMTLVDILTVILLVLLTELFLQSGGASITKEEDASSVAPA